jgi:hypothetical protein
MQVKSHKGSCRQAGLRRALRNIRKKSMALQASLEGITVVLPPDYEGDENVTFRDVLANRVSGAKLKVDGRVTAKSKVAVLVAAIEGEISDVQAPASDIRANLTRLGG